MLKECKFGLFSYKEISKSTSKLSDIIKSLNSQCPAQINNWTTVNSFEMVGNVVTVNFVVVDDVVSSLSPDGFKSDLI